MYIPSQIARYITNSVNLFLIRDSKAKPQINAAIKLGKYVRNINSI